MQRWTAILFAALFFAASFAVVLAKVKSPSPDSGGADAGADAAADAGTDAPSGGAEEDADVAAGAGGDGPGADAGVGRKLLSGEEPPVLAAEAPKSVVFGVILVQYKGAQGALPTARPRDAALELAKQLATEAAQDFKAAVAKGDKGSMENAGRIPRGVLEPAPEYVLFSLPKGGVSEPVDTPRGFWIVQRIE
jgi:parvulin-like peptidyl-prolyl isomerase